MELEQFLQGIKNCPEQRVAHPGRTDLHRLTSEWGIYDNYPVLVQTDFGTVEGFFDNHLHYALCEKARWDSSTETEFIYKPGTVIGKISEIDVQKLETPGHISSQAKEHFEKQKKFNIEINLWPYQGGTGYPGKKMEDVSWERAIALAVLDIGDWALREKIPLCIPDVGWKYLEIRHNNADGSWQVEDNPERFERIVYYKP